MDVLPRGFYLQDALACLRASLGKILLTRRGRATTAGRIVEAEAYVGACDRAAHSYGGKRTPRTEIQFGVGGHAYVFQVHGHQQFCFVAGEAGRPDVVLIRALEPLTGVSAMQRRRSRFDDPRLLTNGPGKLCQSLGITAEHYGADLTTGRRIALYDDGTQVPEGDVVRTTRVGIDYAGSCAARPWRCYVRGSRFVSRR